MRSNRLKVDVQLAKERARQIKFEKRQKARTDKPKE
jgi:hypothetical protein